MVNFCGYNILIGGVLFPAAGGDLVFTPILGGAGPTKTILGYQDPEQAKRIYPDVTDAGDVIIPRHGPAVSWAKKRGLRAWCVPVNAIGVGEVVLDSIDELESFDGNNDLGWSFPERPLYAPLVVGSLWDDNIQCMILSDQIIKTRQHGYFYPIEECECASVNEQTGEVKLQAVLPSTTAVIVPADGRIIRAAAKLDVAVLIAGQPHPALKTVDLYRVA